MINLDSLTHYIESIFTKEQLYIDRFKPDILFVDIDCMAADKKLAIRATFEKIEFSTISKKPEMDFFLYDFALHDQIQAENLIDKIRRTKKFERNYIS